MASKQWLVKPQPRWLKQDLTVDELCESPVPVAAVLLVPNLRIEPKRKPAWSLLKDL